MKISPKPVWRTTIRYLHVPLPAGRPVVLVRASTPEFTGPAASCLAQVWLSRDVVANLGGRPQMIAATTTLPVRFLWVPGAGQQLNAVAGRMLSTLCGMSVAVRGAMVVHAAPDDRGAVPTLSDELIGALASAAMADVHHHPAAAAHQVRTSITATRARDVSGHGAAVAAGWVNPLKLRAIPVSLT